MLNSSHTLSQWLTYIETLRSHNIVSLNNIKKIANRLHLLPVESYVFIVSGTNGKGTTCTVLEQLYLADGYTVGLYTSPHLLHYRERIKINNDFLQDDIHIASFCLIESVRQGVSLTYFEFITLSALILFKEKKLDIIILEVGLGGRLDATNIIDSNIAIITNIGLDHTEVLGNTREKIGQEKSGIFRKHKIAILADTNIPQSIYKIAYQKHVLLKRIKWEWDFKIIKKNWNFRYESLVLYNLPLLNISIVNVATALSAIFSSTLHVSRKIIYSVLTKIMIPGRFQTISHYPKIVIDVAHNPHAALHISKNLIMLLKQDKKMKIYAVFGMLNNKDIKNTILTLLQYINLWCFVPIRDQSVDTVYQYINDLPIKKFKVFYNIINGFNYAYTQATKKDLILIFGSFYSVSEVYKHCVSKILA